MVRRGKADEGTEVVVGIDAKAVTQAARETGRDFRPSGGFWRQQAERALLNHLWTEAALPPAERLAITRVTGTMMNEAMAWTGD